MVYKILSKEAKDMIRDILNEYRWRRDRDFSLIVIHYIDRLRPEGYALLKGEDIVDMGSKFIFTKRGMIPYHRIIRILYNGKVIYQRVESSERHNRKQKK